MKKKFVLIQSSGISSVVNGKLVIDCTVRERIVYADSDNLAELSALCAALNNDANRYNNNEWREYTIMPRAWAKHTMQKEG